jgi:hypothetical protein
MKLIYLKHYDMSSKIVIWQTIKYIDETITVNSLRLR